jgi:transposase
MLTTARRVVISPSTRGQLKRTERRHRAPQRDALRARIILLAGQGLTNAEIAREAGCTDKTVRKWRGRFADNGSVRALKDRKRTGRPARVTVEQRAEVVKLACERPDGSKAAFRDIWTYQSLSEVYRATTGISISASEIGRILSQSDLKPHRARPWLHSPDPEFREKTREVCKLYLNIPAGAHVVCVDEKTGIQALERRFPGRPAVPGRWGREEFEYKRHGTTTLIGAFDVRTGRVFGECRPTRKAPDLVSFMEHLTLLYPKGEVYVVWDNLNIHGGERWTEFNKRHGGRFHFVYTPLHASWLNQIEIWFGILQRRILRRASFGSVAELMLKISGFIAHWNLNEAHPFEWKFRGRFARKEKRAA